MTSTTSALRLTRNQLAQLTKDPEVIRQFELLIARVDALDSGGGGTGAVDSVNGQTGVVVLDAGDVGADSSGTAATLVAAHAALTVGAHGISALAIGGLTAATITVPFGAQEQTATVVDANCTATSKVIVGWGPTTPDDENESAACDVEFSAVPSAGSLAVTVSSNDDNNVGGVYKILYTLG